MTRCRVAALGLVVGLVGLVRPAFAADPGGPYRSVLQSVAALEKPVSYTETKIPLGELVQKVAADTGAPLTAAPGVADEPVAVVVKDYPARELLEQLADLLDYRWMRQGHESAWRYEIYQDLASKQREEALRASAFAAAERRLRDEIGRWAEMARLPEAQIHTMKDTAARELEKISTLPWDQQRALLRSPERWRWIEQEQRAKVLSRPIVRTLADLAGSLTPEQWARLRARRRLVFSTTPEPGELPLPARFGTLFRASRYQGSADRMDGPPEMLRQMNGQLRNMQAEWERAVGYHVILQYGPEGFLTGQGLYLDATVVPSPSPRASLFESGSRFVVGRPGELDWRPAVQVPAERPDAAVTDPVFGRQAVFVPQAKPRRDSMFPSNGPLWQVWDLLPEIARAYHVQAISDAYWSTGAVYGLQFPAEERTLSEQLARTAGGYYQRDRQGDLIRLRSKRWFLDRRREIPLRLVRGWQTSFDRYGELIFAQYVEAAALTDLQLQSTQRLIHRGVLPTSAFSLESGYNARWALRLYASLSPAQQRAIREGKPLSGSRMSSHERELFRAALGEQRPGDQRPERPGQIHWDRTTFSMSSEAMLSVTQKTDHGQTGGTGPVSVRRPGLRMGPLPRRAVPAMALAEIHAAQGQERHPFTAVHLQLTDGLGLHQEYILYVARPR